MPAASDSGVFEQGGLVVSKAGCVIAGNGRATPERPGSRAASAGGAAPAAAAAEPPGSAASSRPGSRASSGSGRGSRSATPASPHGAGAAPPAAPAPAPAPGGADGAPADAAPGGGESPPHFALADLVDEGVVGRGASGVVRRVRHAVSGRAYVLKSIRVDLCSEAGRRGVVAEVRALAGAAHPHVVAYHQSFYADGALTILMEHMDGGSLADVLARVRGGGGRSRAARRRGAARAARRQRGADGRAAPRRAAQVRVVPPRYLGELARQVLSGLAHLHGVCRICHRDIKPSNLLLSSGGALKISDFGTAHQLSASMSKCLSWVGTVTYMSPERIRGDTYGTGTDVWSLGLLLLEAATGRYPYPPEGADAPGRMGFWELLECIVVEPAPRLPAARFGAELADFVGLCLQKDPASRPSAAALLRHPFITSAPPANLADLLRPGGGGGAAPPAPPRAAGAPPAPARAAPRCGAVRHSLEAGRAAGARGGGPFGGGAPLAAGALALRRSAMTLLPLYEGTAQQPPAGGAARPKLPQAPPQLLAHRQQQAEQAQQAQQQQRQQQQQQAASQQAAAAVAAQQAAGGRQQSVAHQQQQQQLRPQTQPQQATPPRASPQPGPGQLQPQTTPHRPVQPARQQQQQQRTSPAQPRPLLAQPLTSGPLTALKPVPRPAAQRLHDAPAA
ncbi:MKK1a [Scenedesmus sp. PABB004]|nr:MKK1a [Scenedesmus sp. PABB004]